MNQGGKPLLVTLINVPSNSELTLLSSFSRKHWSCPPWKWLDKLPATHPSLGSVSLISSSACPNSSSGTPFVPHLLDCLAGQVTFLSGSITINKWPLAGKESLETAMMLHAFLGYKVALSTRALGSKMAKLTQNFIISMKHLRLNATLMAILPHGNVGWILCLYIIISCVLHN